MSDYENKEFDPKAAAEARKAEMAEMNEKIDRGLKEIFSGDKFKEYLEFCSRLPRYSVNNQILIMQQNPDAVMCQPFEKWKDAGRFVKKGEKGIRVLAPYKYKDFTGFKPSSIFDVSQTDGDRMPFIGGPQLSEEQAGDMKNMLDELKGKDLKDYEISSISYITCRHFSQEVEDISIDSIVTWAMDKDNVDLRNCLDGIRRGVLEIISRVEEKIEGRDVEKEIEEFVAAHGDELPFDIGPSKTSVIDDLAKNKADADAEKSADKGKASSERAVI